MQARNDPAPAARAAQSQVVQPAFESNILEDSSTTPQSGFFTVLKMSVNGQDIGHTKSGQLVRDVESSHAEDMAVLLLQGLCADEVAGRPSPMNRAGNNEVWLAISSSPCTSESRHGLPATSKKEIGCTEMLIYLQTFGMRPQGSLWSYGGAPLDPTFKVSFHINFDTLYQPRIKDGKKASERAVKAMKKAGIEFY